MGGERDVKRENDPCDGRETRNRGLLRHQGGGFVEWWGNERLARCSAWGSRLGQGHVEFEVWTKPNFERETSSAAYIGME